jgi:hypothetical protein
MNKNIDKVMEDLLDTEEEKIRFRKLRKLNDILLWNDCPCTFGINCIDED